jgi:uncharacterized protein (DUF486 family)
VSRAILTVVLLICSNVFMTWAWYGHLKQKGWSLVVAILVSWLIALPEYVLQVPANRFGHTSHGGPFSAAQLKVLQEAITLAVFSAFAILVLKERLRTNDMVAFGLIFLAVIVSMMGRSPAARTTPGDASSMPNVEHAP